MRITTKNYFKAVSEVGFENLPEVLKKSHLVIEEKTDNGKDWGIYEDDAEVKRVFDLAFEKLEEFIDKKGDLSGVKSNTQTASDEDLGNTKNKYSGISNEIKFIHMYLNFHDKVLYKNTIGLFIDDLQKAITEKKITKKSPVAKEIMEMQESALKAFNSMRNAKHIMLRPEMIKKLKGIIEKYENAYDDIDESYAKEKKKKKDLNGLGNVPVNIMPSQEFANLEFNTLGFTGKWLDFIGDPAPGFTAMVFGMPKMGKSYLCIDFAGYLARNHGRVLYVAKEEKLDATLQKKLKDKDVAHENLFVSDALPSDLSAYDFVFLDSVNKLGLTAKDLEKLKMQNKGKSFVFVFQATKGGQFKGNNEFQHDVDVVIEIPQKGIATQYGRFNQGGEMNIFEEASYTAENHQTNLSGIAKVGNEKPIVIKPTFSVTLEEFDFLIQRGESVQEAIRANKLEAENWVKKLAEAQIKKAQAQVKVDAVYFLSNDDEEDDEAFSYYDLRISGLENELRKVAGKNKDLYYIWKDEEDISGTKKKSSSKSDSKPKVKKNTQKDWTEPEWLNQSDWQSLKRIKKHCDKGEYKEAMNYAMDCDTVIREEIPGEIWKKMGGQLTKTGEEKLKAKNGKASPKTSEPEKRKQTIVFNSTIRALKGVIEREWDLELTDGDYIELLDIAQERSVNFYEVVTDIHPNLTAFMTQMAMALKIWDKTTGKSEEKSSQKFDPKFYANRKDDDNPDYIFSLTGSKLLAEALKGDFDLIYLVRKELANRGQDSQGKWVGFDEAAKIHRIAK